MTSFLSIGQHMRDHLGRKEVDCFEQTLTCKNISLEENGNSASSD